MKHVAVLSACLFLTLAVAPAYGQGGATSSISGIVVDSGGGVIPGASVVVKDNTDRDHNQATS